MKKFVHYSLGAFSGFGLLLIVGSIIATILESIKYYKFVLSDMVVVALWLLPLTIFTTFLFYKNTKNLENIENIENKKNYKKYEIVTKIIVFGVILTLILDILLFIYLVITNSDPLTYIALLLLFIFGMVATFLISFISWIVIYFGHNFFNRQNEQFVLLNQNNKTA